MSDYKYFVIEPKDQAKETDGAGRLDDSDAFEESSAIFEMEESGQELSAVAKWRAARSLLKLRNQLNAKYPARSKASDGFIGDASHCPNPDGTGPSDHCPNIQDGDSRVVTAFDATHDPDNGCDIDAVVEEIRKSKDPRIKYIIWNRQICNSKAIGGVPSWTWRKYTGKNPHTRHCHLSVFSEKKKYDDTSEWKI